VTIATDHAPQAFRFVAPNDYNRAPNLQSRMGPPPPNTVLMDLVMSRVIRVTAIRIHTTLMAIHTMDLGSASTLVLAFTMDEDSTGGVGAVN